MTLYLQVTPQRGKAYKYDLNSDTILIGRSSTSNLVLDDEVVSRTHARIFRERDRWQVEDMGSHNGTFLNGSKINQPTLIKPGDVLRISANIITIQEEELKSIPMALPSHETGDFFKSVHEVIRVEESISLLVEPDIKTLRIYAERFRILNSIHAALSKPFTKDELLDLIMDRIFTHLTPEEGTIYLKDRDGQLCPVVQRGTSGQMPLHSQSLIEEVTVKGMGALVNDVLIDERFSEAQSIVASGMRSILATPLLDSDGILGMIMLGSRTTVKHFSEEDLELLVSIATAATLRLRNMIISEEAAEKLREINRTLEHKVEERTKELKKTNEEIIRTRDQLIFKEKMASLGTLTAGVAHEIRNPLNFINNFADLSAELLEELSEETEEQKKELNADFYDYLKTTFEDLKEHARYIVDHGLRADRIVQSMAELAMEGVGKFELVNLNQIISESTQLSYKGYKAKNPRILIKIQEDFNPGLDYLELVSAKIRRLVISLVNNALEAIHEKLEQSDEEYEPFLILSSDDQHPYAQFTIEDNGIGIPEAEIPKIFTPFHTSKPPGTGHIGMGLSSAFEIVSNEHNGEITLESEQGVGTKVFVKLPKNATPRFEKT